jgi:GNAT superfamily N-acetyltransferase
MADVRPGTSADIMPAFAVFRRSLWDLLQRSGVMPADRADNLDRAWAVMQSSIEHLAEHASEFWVAEDEGGLVGMARSIERDGVLQLTEFFVDPATQSRGIGRALLDRAFPPGRGRHRSIIATTDPRALSLYLRSGVRFQTLLAPVTIEPDAHAFETDLEFIPLDAVDDPVAAIAALDRRHLDHERTLEIEFLIGDRPGFLLRRDSEYVGYGFGSDGHFAGPALVDRPSDLPAVLSQMENSAAEAGIRRYDVEFALDARTAVDWALARGHRLSAFYTALLGSSAFVPRDRYVLTGPVLFL